MSNDGATIAVLRIAKRVAIDGEGAMTIDGEQQSAMTIVIFTGDHQTRDLNRQLEIFGRKKRKYQQERQRKGRFYTRKRELKRCSVTSGGTK